MADDTGDKTEAPTAKRRQQAAESGQVARSPDLVAAALVVGSMMLLNSFGAGVIQALKTILTEMLGEHALADVSTGGATRGMVRAVGLIGKAMMPMMIGLL